MIMKEYEVNHKECFVDGNLDVDGIIAKFKANGFNVTTEAILHNFEAWQADFKSGYRDEANGYFLFSPCGCNPLRLNATELVGEPWQRETYFC